MFNVPVELSRQIFDCKGLKPMAKWLYDQMSKTAGMTNAMAGYKIQTKKQIIGVLSRSCPSLLSDVIVPSEYESLRDDILQPQAWAMAEAHMYIGHTPYGLPEVRFLCSGSYVCAGVPLAKLQGDTLKQKVYHVLTEVGMAQFFEVVQRFHST